MPNLYVYSYAFINKAKRVSIIRNASQPYSDFLGTQFAKDLVRFNPGIVIQEKVMIEGASQFKALVDDVLEFNADLVFVPLTQSAIASIYVELVSRNAKLTLLTSDTIEKTPQFLDQIGHKNVAVRFIYPKHWNEKFQGPDVEKYQTAYNQACSSFPNSMTSVAAFDAAELLVRTLKKNPSLRGTALLKAMKDTVFHGLTGPFIWGADGDPIKPLELFEFKKGLIVYWMRYE